MSSGFVSAGTNEEPVERDDAWIRAQKELEEERRLKAEAGQQKDGKSLFEVLQQNKSELPAFSPSYLSAGHHGWWRRSAKARLPPPALVYDAIGYMPVTDDKPI
jgi:hypothetical protein